MSLTMFLAFCILGCDFLLCSSGYTSKSQGTTPAGRQHAGKCAAPSPANAYSRFLSAPSSTEPATSDPAADENGLKAVQ